MTAMHDVFISELRELVAQATDDLIAIEREGFSTERVDRVFRAFHTLKGSAGLVALPAMGLTLHAAEDLVAAIHAERLPASAAVIDQALACLDLVSQWVDAFEADGMLPPQSEGDARAMTDRLRNLLSGQAIQEENKAKGSATGRCRTGSPACRRPSAMQLPTRCGVRARSLPYPTSRSRIVFSMAMIRLI